MSTLLSFTVENFRSIAEQKTIVLTPDPSLSGTADDCDEGHLRTVAIYGANSSGKSNLIHALGAMTQLVHDSVKINDKDKLLYDPFRFNEFSEGRPTLYEVSFVTDGVQYRYGFSNTDEQVYDEWLLRISLSGDEEELFVRTEEGIGIDEELFAEGRGLEERTNDNRLFLSVVGQLGGAISNSVLRFFNNDLNVLSGLNTALYQSYTKRFLDANDPGVAEMKEFFSRLRLGFEDLVTMRQEVDISKLPEDLPDVLVKGLVAEARIKVLSSHGIYDEKGHKKGLKNFDFEELESSGTRKLFDMAGPIFETIKSGNVLVIDELDAKMHPLMSQEIVALFNDPRRNPNGAQLLFTTHDTNLLSNNLLGRDQIWFTEKDEQERTDLYCMAQIVLPDGSEIPESGNMERNYIQGRYGAIPYITPYVESYGTQD